MRTIDLFRSKIEKTLESHQNLKLDGSLSIYFRVLGEEHMEYVRKSERFALNAADVINEGGVAKKSRIPSYMFRVPLDYPGFKGLCLPLSIILGCKIELGFQLNRHMYKVKGKNGRKINSPSEKLQKIACEALSKEYKKLQRRIPELLRIRKFTFKNTVHLLQKYYQVNRYLNLVKF